MRLIPDHVRCKQSAYSLFLILEEISRMPTTEWAGTQWVCVPGYLLTNARTLVADCAAGKTELRGGKEVFTAK